MAYRPPIIREFFVFNPTLQTSEDTAEDALLFFYPNSVPLGHKLKQMGVVQALTGLVGRFAPGEPLSVMETKKKKVAVLMPEPNVWIVLAVRKAWKGNENDPNGGKIIDRPHNDAVMAVVHGLYQRLRLFNGYISEMVEKFPVSLVREKLEAFLFPEMERMFSGHSNGVSKGKGKGGVMVAKKIKNSVNFATAAAATPSHIPRPFVDLPGVLSTLGGVRFYPANRRIYISVTSMVAAVQQAFPQIASAMVLRSCQVVYTSFPSEETTVLYNFLATASPLAQDLDPSFTRSVAGNSNVLSHRPGQSLGHYLCGPRDVNDPNSPVSSPRVFLRLAESFVKRSVPSSEDAEEVEAKRRKAAEDRRQAEAKTVKEAASGGIPEPPKEETEEERLISGAWEERVRLHPHRLVLYSYGHAAVLFSVEGSTVPDPQFFSHLDAFLQPRMAGLFPVRRDGTQAGGTTAKPAASGVSSAPSSGGPERFVYVNTVNQALKTSLGASTPSAGEVMPSMVFDTISAMVSDQKAHAPHLERHSPAGTFKAVCLPYSSSLATRRFSENATLPCRRVTETVAQDSDGNWVCGRCSDGRYFYVMASPKCSNLLDVHADIQRLSANYFSNIFVA